MSAISVTRSSDQGWRRSPIVLKLYAWTFCLVCIFAFFHHAINALWPGWPGAAAASADEIAVLMVLAALTYNAATIGRVNVWLVYLAGLAAISIIFTAAFGDTRPWSARILQSGIHLKLPLLLLITTWSGWWKYGRTPAKYTFRLIISVSVIGILWHFVFPSHFEGLFDVSGKRRLGFQRTGGLSLMPNDLALLFVFVAFGHALSLAAGLAKPRSIKTVGMVASLVLVVAITGSRAGLVGCALYLACLAILDKSRISALVLVVLAVGLGALFTPLIVSLADLTSHNIQTLSDIENTRYIRGIMIYYSFVLANQHFPFGAGLASFGSAMSSGSVTYTELNVATTYFFENAQGIFDSNFASLVGELGYLLAATYYIVTGVLLYRIVRNALGGKSFRLVATALITFVFLLSFVFPIFTHGPSAVALALMFSIDRRRKLDRRMVS